MLRLQKNRNIYHIKCCGYLYFFYPFNPRLYSSKNLRHFFAYYKPFFLFFFPQHFFKNPQINCCSFLKNHDILALSSLKPCFFFITLLPFVLVLILCLLQAIYPAKLFHIISHCSTFFFKLYVVVFFKVTHELRGVF